MQSQFEERIESSSFPRIRLAVDRMEQDVDSFKNSIQRVGYFLLGHCAWCARVRNCIANIKACLQAGPPCSGLTQWLFLKALVEKLKTIFEAKHLERVSEFELAILQRYIPFLQDALFQNG